MGVVSKLCNLTLDRSYHNSSDPLQWVLSVSCSTTLSNAACGESGGPDRAGRHASHVVVPISALALQATDCIHMS